MTSQAIQTFDIPLTATVTIHADQGTPPPHIWRYVSNT